MNNLLVRISVCVLVLGLWRCTATAKTWNINPDGNGDAATVQAGIDSAGAGDIVLLSPGRYAGPGNRDIDFNGKAITVTSSSGAAVTTIDCENLGRGFVFQNEEGSASVLAGVRIINGYHAAFGGAVWCVNASPVLEDNIFFENHAEIRGGAVYCDTSSAEVSGNIFEGNTASYGGALSCSGLSDLTISGTEFKMNTADISGGAVACRASAPTLDGNLFEQNESVNEGGALYCDQDASALVTTNVFRGNVSAGNGGAIALLQSSPSIEYNVFRTNSAVLGGGIYCNDFSAGPIRYNTFDENDASSGSGAGVYCTNYSAPPISNNIVTNSTSGNPVDTKNDSVPLIGCCCFFNNAGGDARPPGSFDGGGNFAQDPEFCGIDGSGNYELQSDSPCAPGEHPTGAACDGIGAFPVGCATTSAEMKTWGAIKEMYRSE